MRSGLARASQARDGSSPSRRRVAWAGGRVAAAAAVATLCVALQPGAASAACANEARRAEQQSEYLPDCRAYEQVSPVEKGGSSVSGGLDGQWAVAAQQGSAVLYGLYGTLPGGQDSLLGSSLYGSARTQAGWSIRPLDGPLTNGIELAGGNDQIVGASANVSKVAVISTQPLSSGPVAANGHVNMFIRSADGSYALVTDHEPTGAGSSGLPPSFDFPVLDGASADMSHVLFQTDVPLLPEASGEVANNLYEWDEGRLSMADVLPGGEVAPGGAYAGATEAGGKPVAFTNPISEDGSRIFFVAGGQLYVREDGARTVKVSAPQAGGTEGSASFLYATPDGSKVLFTDTGKLTASTSPAGADLYEYDVATGKLTDLSLDKNPADASTGAGVYGVLGLSRDGSRVYFAASGELVSHPADGSFAQIYLWHEGAVSWVAPASSSAEWTPAQQDAFVSADGNHLLLQSTQQLTRYENAGFTEIYLYSALSGAIECISCNPSGAAPEGSADAGAISATLGQLFIWALPHPISADGSRVFFETPDALVSGDTNKAEDVYEWEQGHVHLISSGTAAGGAYLGDASGNGEDVFFVTHGSLLKQDEDQSGDLYDARVLGGVAGPPLALPGCEGAQCREPVEGPPVFAQIVSMSFEGAGNRASAGSGASTPSLRVNPAGSSAAVVRLWVKVSGPGRLAAWSGRLRKARRRVARAGRYLVRLRMRPRTAAALRHGHRVKVKVHVRYTHTGGRAITETLQLVLRGGKGR